MNKLDFKTLSNDIVVQGESKGGRSSYNSIKLKLASIYHNKIDREKYLLWLTEYSQSEDVAFVIKGIQKNINLSLTQRALLNLNEKNKITQKIRLMRANKPLFHKGLCSRAQIIGKEYMFIVEDLVNNIQLQSQNEIKIPSQELLENILNSDERHVIYLYFGFLPKNPMSLEDIAKFTGKSKEILRKIKNRAINKLKENSEVGEDFVEKFNEF